MARRLSVVGLTIGFALFSGITFQHDISIAAPKYRMVYIVKAIDNPFWQMMLSGAQNAAKELNLEIKGLAPIKANNVEEQIRMMEDAITLRVNAIIVAPGDNKGIVPGVEKANRAGIPVVCTNDWPTSGRIVAWAGAANEEASYLIGKSLLERMGGKGNVVILEGVPGSLAGIDRRKGLERAIKEFPTVKLLTSQTARFSRVEGMRVMENILQQFPQIDGVMCANDEMALGAIEAIDAARRLNNIKVCGFDGNNDAMRSISEGRLVVTGAQRPDAQGYWAVLAAFMHLEGYPVPRELYVPCPVVDKSNVSEYLQRIKK